MLYKPCHETIFDGGLRRSTMAQYAALYNADIAGYKQNGFDSVSTNRGLSLLIATAYPADRAAAGDGGVCTTKL
jgi:hypothetical protein